MQKTIVITGATSGIGFEAAKALVAQGHTLICIGRNDERIQKAAGQLKQISSSVDFTFINADLSTGEGIQNAAREISSHTRHIDALLNVAGAISGWYVNTREGFELQFATNHLAPYRLTCALMPFLKDSRVITVSSNSHRGAKIYFNDVMLKRNYHSLRAYKQSKLANVLFTHELALRYGGYMRAMVFDPGLMRTEIGLKGGKPLEQFVWKIRMKQAQDPAVAGKHLADMATEEKYLEETHLYYQLGIPKQPHRRGVDPASSKRLWNLSARYAGLDESWSPSGT